MKAASRTTHDTRHTTEISTRSTTVMLYNCIHVASSQNGTRSIHVPLIAPLNVRGRGYGWAPSWAHRRGATLHATSNNCGCLLWGARSCLLWGARIAKGCPRSCQREST